MKCIISDPEFSHWVYMGGIQHNFFLGELKLDH